MYLKEYDRWLHQEKLSNEEKNELLQMDDDEKMDAFSNAIEFGTGGLRGIMGMGINRINLYVIRRVTAGFATYLSKNNLTKGIAISYDNRINSRLFALEAAKVLAFYQIPVHLFESLRPTPMLSFAVRHFKLSGGIMITASHNPKEYNGYKVYNQDGAQLDLNQSQAVTEAILDAPDYFDIKLGDDHLITYINESFDDVYLSLVKKIQIHSVDKPLKIVFSPLHGTGGTVIPKLLKESGYSIYPYLPQMKIDGTFPNTQSSNPEEDKAYIETLKYAKEIDADMILVTDPDADRLGVVVKHHDTYLRLNGNQTAAVELYYILTNRVFKNGYVFTTNVTTSLIEDMAKFYNQTVITTLTGFKFIGEQAKLIEKNGTYVFGCEESYGSLISDFVRDKDAVQACYMLSEIANYLHQKQQTLIDYLETIYQQFGYYYEYTENITLKGVKGKEIIQQIMTYYRESEVKQKDFIAVRKDDILNGLSFATGSVDVLNFPKQNVIKYYDSNHNWIVFRPSGTEPKLKIYYCFKGETMEAAKAEVRRLNEQILNQIKEIEGKAHV